MSNRRRRGFYTSPHIREAGSLAIIVGLFSSRSDS